MDDQGRLYWLNGPDHHCYLSEQRQWRSGLSFEQVLEWKQCAPSGLVSQRFPSLQAACEAFEHNLVHWSTDLYLRRMGDEMAMQRAVADYKPTALKEEEQRSGCIRRQPWLGSPNASPRCELPAPSGELPHLRRRRRSSARPAALTPPVR